MDRIDTSLLQQLGLTPGKPVGPRAMDPSPRLRLIDRQDTVELTRPAEATTAAANPVPSSQVPSSQVPSSQVASSLVAASVPGSAAAAAPVMPPNPAGSAAMKLYSNPSDQNAAATRGAAANAGSVLDILA